MKHKSLFLAIFIILTSCHPALNISKKPVSTLITHDVKFNLLSMKELNKTATLNQYFDAKYKDSSFSINVITNILPSELSVIGLTDLGSRIFTVKYNDSKIDFTYPQIIKLNNKIQPEYMIADMQLIYFPLAAIQKNLDRKITVQENLVGDKLQRIFYYQNTAFIKINYSDFLDAQKQRDLLNSKVEFVNLERNYQYKITNLKP